MNPSAPQDDFAAMWASAQPMVTAYIASVVRNFHETEDVLQKVATVAFQKQGQYDRQRPFSAWVTGIARLELLRWRRDQARDRHVFSDETIARLEESHSGMKDELDERRAALQACFLKLDGRAKRFVEMRYLRDMPLTQIATRLGMQATAVRVSLHRVRQALQRCIERQLSGKGAKDV